MLAVVQAKKSRRLAKQRIFNCIVIDGDDVRNSPKEFIKTVYDRCAGNSARFQVIYKFNIHWSTADFYIHDGQMSVFLIDAAATLKSIAPFVQAIQDAVPTAKIYFSGGSLQRDFSCATFAIDHAFCLSSMVSLHAQLQEIRPSPEILLARRTQLGEIDETKPFATVHYLALADFPPALGPLVRNSQYVELLKEFLGKNENNLFWQGNANESMRAYFLNRRACLNGTDKQQKKYALLTKYYPEFFDLETPDKNLDEFYSNPAIFLKTLSIKEKTIRYLEVLVEQGGRLQSSIMGSEQKIIWPMSNAVLSFSFEAPWATKKRQQKKMEVMEMSENTPLIEVEKKSCISCCTVC
jgi:hypothetical protein